MITTRFTCSLSVLCVVLMIEARAQAQTVAYVASGSIPDISPDGRYVAFESGDSNLVPADTNATVDVFLHDRQTGTIERVSVGSSGSQGNGYSGDASISDDGRHVAFWSLADNLIPNDTNGVVDIFIHDRQTAATTCISVDSQGVQGNDDSPYPAVSADGRYVAFLSLATNLVGGDTNGVYDIFLHDRQTAMTERVSVSSAGVQGNGSSGFPLGGHGPSISSDGRYVAFHSIATNLVLGDTNGATDVFLHDQQTGVTERASLDSFGGQGNGSSGSPALSGSGDFVAFESGASNLVPGDINSNDDIFVHDRQTGTTKLVSVDTSGSQSNGSTYQPDISLDGQHIGFQSYATNLVPDDTNGTWDIFVHDCSSGVTRRVSTDSYGQQSNAWSFRASLSGDGRYVAFDSAASNLVPGATNGGVFVSDRDCDACPVNYCTAGVSASGCSAMISSSGAASATASSGFFLVAANVEGAKDGLFFYGSNGRQANPWGNGTSYQCVVPPVKRGSLLDGVGTVNGCDGSFSQDLNALWCSTCPKPLHNPGAGVLVQAQLWYRDPGTPSNQTTSMSGAIEFLVGP